MLGKEDKNRLNIMAWNVNNIANNNKELRDRIQNADPDILVLGEIIEAIDSKAHLGLSDRTIYNINPVPNKGSNGGSRAGVVLIIKNNIEHHCKHVLRVENEPDHEGLVQAITVKLKGGTHVTGIYNSPATPAARFIKAMDELKNIEGQTHIIIGDMNARCKKWDCENNYTGGALTEWGKSNKYRIKASRIPSYPPKKGSKGCTKRASNIDLIVHNSKQDIELTASETTGSTEGSDHLPVTAKVDTQLTRKETEQRVPKTMLRSTVATEEASIRHAATMPTLARNMKECTKANMQKMAQNMEKEIKGPWAERVKTRHRHHPVPWWTAECAKKKKKTHNLFLQWKRAQGNNPIHLKLHTSQKDYKRKKRRAYACFLRQNIENIQKAPQSEMAEAVKRDMSGRKKRESNAKRRGPQLEPSGFTKFMANVGGVSVTEELARFDGFDEERIPGDLETLILRAIAEMDPNKAVGVDGVHVEMLKANNTASARMLKELWKAIGRTAQIPKTWLQSTLIPVHKNGKQDEPGNYRPLCMLSHVRKVL